MTDPVHEELSRLRHDLRTPLAVVAGFAELLASERPISDEQRRDWARRIAQAAGELRSIVEARE